MYKVERAIILDGDLFVQNNAVLGAEFDCSGYNAVWTETETNKWLMDVGMV